MKKILDSKTLEKRCVQESRVSEETDVPFNTETENTRAQFRRAEAICIHYRQLIEEILH